MMVKKFLFILFFISFLATTVFSQIYEKQVGILMGVTSGITGKVIKEDRVAIAGIFGFRNGGVQIYGLLESYHPIIKTNTQRWMMYFGGGGHIGYIDGYNRVRRWSNTSGYYWEEQRTSGAVIGIDGVVGTEYTFNKVPITISLQFKPFLELQSFQKFKVGFWDVGFGITYSFKNRK